MKEEIERNIVRAYVDGMPIKDIQKFSNWCINGDNTLQERYNMFLERKKIVLFSKILRK